VPGWTKITAKAARDDDHAKGPPFRCQIHFNQPIGKTIGIQNTSATLHLNQEHIANASLVASSRESVGSPI
jgi:hypothetical protein